MIAHTYKHTHIHTQCPAVQKSFEFLKMCSGIDENTQGAKFIVLFGSKNLIKSVQFALKISHLCRHFVSVANFNFCQNWVFQLHLVLGKYVIWGYFQKDVLIDLHLNFQTNGKLPVMQGATQSITPTGANHKDPVQQTVLDFIWHFSFHYALCHSELRILLSYRNLQKNLSGGVGERTQNKVSTGICVILHKVQVILGRMEWKQDPKIIWPVRATSIKLFLMLK